MNRAPFKVGFDFNGTVVDSTHTKVRLASRYFDIKLDPQNSVRRTIESVMSEREYNALQRLTFQTSEALQTPPLPDAVRALRSLKDFCTTYIVTNLAPEGVQFGRQWLAENDLSRDMLLSVGRGGEKGWVVEAGEGFDVFVDDRPESLAALGSGVKHKLLIDRPYNRSCPLPAGVIRIESWRGVQQFVTERASKGL